MLFVCYYFFNSSFVHFPYSNLFICLFVYLFLVYLFICLFVCWFACLFVVFTLHIEHVACMLTWYAAFVHLCLERFQPLFSSFIQPQTCMHLYMFSSSNFKICSIALPMPKENWLTNGIFPWVALSLSLLGLRDAIHIVWLSSQPLEMKPLYYEFYAHSHDPNQDGRAIEMRFWGHFTLVSRI